MKLLTTPYLTLLILALLSPMKVFAEEKSAPVNLVSFCRHQENYYIRPSKMQSNQLIKRQKLGALTSISFIISKELNGPQIGLVVTSRLDLDLRDVTAGPNSLMQTSATTFFKEGTVVSVKVQDYDQERYMKVVERPILGGTGKFRNANGISISEPITIDGKEVAYKTTLKLVMPCDQL